MRFHDLFSSFTAKIEDSSSKFNNEDMEEMLRTKTNTNLKLDMSVEEELLPLPQGHSDGFGF